MKHLVVSKYGSFLGTRNGLLYIRDSENSEKRYPLNRLSSVSIAKRGISLSSDLVESMSLRGIKLFFLNFRGTAQSVLIGNVRHGVVLSRKNQFQYCENNDFSLARKIIVAKIKNQRAVLNYFSKYHKRPELFTASERLKTIANTATTAKNRDNLLGFEGVGARLYFDSLRDAELFSSTFQRREGRGSQEINNSMLNLGYAVLSSYILGAIENAGLEPYLGVIHAERPGKLALVLDIMEEYRAWVVDRVVVKLRTRSEKQSYLSSELKSDLISEIQGTCSKKYLYKKKMVKLENIIQRQIYKLNGHFSAQKKYRPYLFKW